MDAAGWNQRHATTKLVRDGEPQRILDQPVEVADGERVRRIVTTTDGERTAIHAPIRARRPVER